MQIQIQIQIQQKHWNSLCKCKYKYKYTHKCKYNKKHFLGAEIAWDAKILQQKSEPVQKYKTQVQNILYTITTGNKDLKATKNWCSGQTASQSNSI